MGTCPGYMLYSFDVLIALCVLFWVRELLLTTISFLPIHSSVLDT